jgi:hypothetical protein
MIFLFFLSPSPVRHTFYETFLNIYIILAAVALTMIYFHCAIDKLPVVPYI